MTAAISLARKTFAETLGTALLLATIVGSGIMGANLASGNTAIALLANSIATAAMLFVLILILGPLSGAHLNPIVTLANAVRGETDWRLVAPFVFAQLAGAALGVWLAHAMFDLEILQTSMTVRSSVGQWIAEAVATFGLLLTIFGCSRTTPRLVPCAVALYILAAYWFTASTSFANPAVTLARALTNTFAGIAPVDVPAFVIAQLTGCVVAVAAGQILWSPTHAND